MFHMRSKLYLGLKSSKLTSFLEGDRVGAIQDIIPSLKHKRKQKASGAWGERGILSKDTALHLSTHSLWSKEKVPAKWGTLRTLQVTPTQKDESKRKTSPGPKLPTDREHQQYPVY